MDTWLKLEPRVHGEHVTGQVRVSIIFEEVSKRQYGPQDFEILRLIEKEHLVKCTKSKERYKGIYAMKVLSKRADCSKEGGRVIQSGERNILVRTAMAKSPFIVGLKFSFQTPTDFTW